MGSISEKAYSDITSHKVRFCKRRNHGSPSLEYEEQQTEHKGVKRSDPLQVGAIGVVPFVPAVPLVSHVRGNIEILVSMAAGNFVQPNWKTC